MQSDKLTVKQQMFVKEYLVDLNATQAAIRAGYSSRTANRTAAKWLSKAVIQEAIQKAMDKRATRIELSADMVLSELRDMVMVPLGKLEENGMTCAAKIKAIELAMKHLRILNEKLDVGVTVQDVIGAFPPSVASMIKEAIAKKLN